jgi:dTMP kinase
LDPECSEISSKSELFLYSASRAQLVNEIIEPALKKGSIVLADRFGWSTLAYQGFGRGLNATEIKSLLSITCGDIWPKKTFILDISVDEFRRRSAVDGRIPDRIEQEAGEFFNRVRLGYQNIAAENSESVTLLDGTKNIEEINKYIVDTILTSLKEDR